MRLRGVMRGDVAGAPSLGESRAYVLGVLQEAQTSIGVAEVAGLVHLHANTVRFHLDGLVEMGLAVRANEVRDHPGRPRALYAASPDSAPVGRRSYRLLAEILTAYLAGRSESPATAAVAAGESWGRALAGELGVKPRPSSARARRLLVETLDEVGFAPEPVAARSSRRVVLHHCPFQEAAEEHGEVVCSVHLGLMRGLLDEIDAPVQVRELRPFVDADRTCVTYLERRDRVVAVAPPAG